MRAKHRGRALALISFVIGSLLSLWLWSAHRGYEQGIAESAYREDAQRFVALLDESMRKSVDAVYYLLALHEASERVTSEEFQTFTSSVLRRNPELLALEWAEMVEHAQREEFTQEARYAVAPSYEIRERGRAGEMVPAEGRSRYLPVKYLNPLRGNEQALGFDLLSEASRKSVVERAEETGRHQVTAPIELVQRVEGGAGILIVVPAYQPPRSSGESQRLQGFYVGVLGATKLVQSVLERAGNPDLIVDVDDRTDRPVSILDAGTLSKGEPTAGRVQLLEQELVFAGRKWSVQCSVDEGAILTAESNLAVLTLALGFALTLALCVILLQQGSVRARLYQYAYRDPLTGLPNRGHFQRDLVRVQRSLREGAEKSYTAIFINIDRFKLINDSLGYKQGDHLLIEIARRLSRCVGRRGSLARIGADEFTVLMKSHRDDPSVTEVIQDIERALAAPFELATREVMLTCSMGVASISSETERADELLRASDIAMHKAKVQGRNRFVFYETSMQEERASLQRLEQDLRKAVAYNELSLNYQPIVSLRSGQVEAFEALLRWRHPEHGRIPAESFLGVAEETGLIADVGDWVLREVCRNTTSWMDLLQEKEGQPAMRIHINVSPTQLLRPSLRARIASILDEHPAVAKYLTFEITETVLIEDPDRVLTILSDLRERGLQFSLDDFGTGYASFRSLMRLPIDSVKIDKSFIGRMHHSERHQELLSSMMRMAHGIDLSVTAEGVEEQVQAESLVVMGCDAAQGYLFSPPVEVDAVPGLVGTVRFQVPASTH